MRDDPPFRTDGLARYADPGLFQEMAAAREGPAARARGHVVAIQVKSLSAPMRAHALPTAGQGEGEAEAQPAPEGDEHEVGGHGQGRLRRNG